MAGLKRLAANLDARYELRRQRLRGTVTAVPMVDGRSTGQIVATVGGVAGVRVNTSKDARAPLAIGDGVMVEGVGSPAAMVYSVVDRLSGGRADSDVYLFPAAVTVGDTSYEAGDIVLGSTLDGWSNWWYQFADGRWIIRQGTVMHGAIGNLDDLYGYTAPEYGTAFGQYSAGQVNVTTDPTNGFRIRTHADVALAIDATNGIRQYTNGVQRSWFKQDGSGWLVGSDKIYWDTSGNLSIAGNFAVSTIDIGGADATSFHVDVDGNVWSGAAAYANGGFRVSSSGSLTASSVTISGAMTPGPNSVIDGQYITAKTITANALSITAGGANMLLNSTFEVDTDDDGVADGWQVEKFVPATTVASIVTSGGVDNRSYARITWGYTPYYFDFHTGSDIAGGGVQGGWLANTDYIISFWARSSAVSELSVTFGTSTPDIETWLSNTAVTTSWQRYVLRVKWTATTPPTLGSFALLVTSEVETGTFDLDHVQVEQADTPSAWKPFPSEIEPGTITADKLSVSTLSAISANMGSLTAGNIVVGSTDKLWLNDSGDGSLNIGGSTKASAPFRVSSSGSLYASNASIVGSFSANGGDIDIDSTGITINSASSFDYFKLINTSIATNPAPIGFLNFDLGDPLGTELGTVCLGRWVDADNQSVLWCYPDTVSLAVEKGGVWKNLVRANFDFIRLEGPVLLPSGTATPTASLQDAQIYVDSSGRLVIQWLSGGVTRYKWLTLTDTSTTWSYSTSPP